MLQKTAIIEILNDWRLAPDRVSLTVPRDVLANSPGLEVDIVLAIQGVRRSGKSTLLRQLVGHHRLDAQHCFFVNFEDPRLVGSLHTDLLDAIIAVAESSGAVAARETRYYLFDEIQNIPNWEKWLHAQIERSNNRSFVVTGSNASLLSGDLATSLTGRHHTIEVFPFSYGEFKLARRADSHETGFESYIRDGGFPRPIALTDPMRLLREYFSDIVERDVRRHTAARSSQLLMQLARAIFASAGAETSLRNLSKTFDVAVDTLHSYIDALVASYLVLPCPYFTYSERQRVVRPNKYYPIDTGMHRAVLGQPTADNGKYLETIVFHHLRKLHRRVFYWRKTREIDFVVLDGLSPVPIQVSWDGQKTKHEESYAEFKAAYPDARPLQVISRLNIEAFLG